MSFYIIPDEAVPERCYLCKREVVRIDRHQTDKRAHDSVLIEYATVKEINGKFRGQPHMCSTPHRPEYSSTTLRRVRGG